LTIGLSEPGGRSERACWRGRRRCGCRARCHPARPPRSESGRSSRKPGPARSQA